MIVIQQKINSDITYILYTKTSFSSFFLGTFMKFSSAEEIDGTLIHFPDGETRTPGWLSDFVGMAQHIMPKLLKSLIVHYTHKSQRTQLAKKISIISVFYQTLN